MNYEQTIIIVVWLFALASTNAHGVAGRMKTIHTVHNLVSW